MEVIYHNFITNTANLSSLEIAKFFAYIYESKLKYTPEAGWFSYQEDDGIWLKIADEEVKKLVIEQIEILEGITTETEIQDSLKKLKTMFRINEIIGFLKTYLLKNLSGFDVNPFVLALKNCILDLETLSIIDGPDRAGLYVTRQMNASFVETPPNLSRWLDFLHSILPADVVEFLQVFLGYSLTGSTEERKFLIFYGPGANGKTTLTNVLKSIWNSYALTVNPNLFIKNSPDKLFCLAHLKGIRLGIAPELPMGVFDTSLIKVLTGKDRIQARFLAHPGLWCKG